MFNKSKFGDSTESEVKKSRSTGFLPVLEIGNLKFEIDSDFNKGLSGAIEILKDLPLELKADRQYLVKCDRSTIRIIQLLSQSGSSDYFQITAPAKINYKGSVVYLHFQVKKREICVELSSQKESSYSSDTYGDSSTRSTSPWRSSSSTYSDTASESRGGGSGER